MMSDHGMIFHWNYKLSQIKKLLGIVIQNIIYRTGCLSHTQKCPLDTIMILPK